MKPNLLVFCSWLYIHADAGDFFIEQSDLVSDCYTMILVVFRKDRSRIKKLNHRKKSYIVENRTQSGLLVLEIYFPYNEKYPIWVKNYFKEKTLKLLNSYLIKNKIEVSLIHAQSIFDAGIWTYEYFLKYNVPYLLTEHNQLTFFKVEKEKSKLVGKMLEKAKKICVVSNDKARQFYANGLYYDYFNVGNLVHERFCYLEKEKNKTKRLITIGAYHYLKNQKIMIRALSELDIRIKNKIEFVWIGFDSWGGNFEKEIAALFENLNFKNIEIILIPILGREEVVEHLQNADAFVFSSLSEGMPVSVLEALACGLPVFTSNCGGVDEIINTSNGHIYPINDYLKLADLLFDFLDKKMDYDNSQISENIINKFGHKAFRNKLIEVYEDLLW